MTTVEALKHMVNECSKSAGGFEPIGGGEGGAAEEGEHAASDAHVSRGSIYDVGRQRLFHMQKLLEPGQPLRTYTTHRPPPLPSKHHRTHPTTLATVPTLND